MRRYLKKKLKGMLNDLMLFENSLCRAINEQYMETNENISSGKYTEDVEQSLVECQNAAILIGTEIEETEGEGTKAVALLEKYCESVYQASIAFQNRNKVDLKIHLNAMITYLDRVNDRIENEFHNDKLEVVFLPYMASMWDSLETVWMAAKEDPECNAYVVPIPYYDKNSDGSFKEMHYEGEEYPESVPIIDWRTIDLEKLHPDVIYFHNPYDNYNLVTSVHPDFYSSKLKMLTEMLVYIPYFVSEGDVAEHLCNLIGIYHANKVIIQSEKMKETYKKVYIDTLGEEQRKAELAGAPHNIQFWNALNTQADEKFLPLGSPKFDKILTPFIDLDSIPAGWNKIYHKDGTKKKIVLYNTTIQAFLDYKEKYLIKLEHVLRTFENSKDTIILWRPHPLLMATIESMAQDIAKKYLLIVEEFKNKNYGIYDDTADLSRAIRISDAYYGDMSSVVTLYKATGKPIMIQSVTIVAENF